MHRLGAIVVVTALLALPRGAPAEVQTRELEYRHGPTVLQGLLAWDDATEAARPGVLVVHEWWGHNQHARNQAKRLAEAGYVSFALDMFGTGKVTTHPEDAQAFVAEVMRDPVTIPARFNLALELLKKDPHVNPNQIAAIGYCFGGSVALGMARRGADLDAVISFHGALATPEPAQAGQVRARILSLTGADDPMIPPEQVEAFKKEMQAAGANFEVVTYPGAKHSFTNPDADQLGMEALAYNAEAAQKAWAAMLKLLKEVFP